jgi:hypothetical protein
MKKLLEEIFKVEKYKGPHFLERILQIDYKKMEGCSAYDLGGEA